jgi:hypothetical protein
MASHRKLSPSFLIRSSITTPTLPNDKQSGTEVFDGTWADAYLSELGYTYQALKDCDKSIATYGQPT